MKASVIIPAYNAEKTIAKCLTALEKQSLPRKSFEIIVVDDGSTDPTAETVRKFKNVTLVRQANGGPALARNNGAKKTTGEILVFLDSDCVPRKDWLEKMLEPFENPEVAGVQGKYFSQSRNWMARFVQLEIEERYARMEKNEFIDFIGSYSAAYRKKIFLEANGFDTGFRMASGEDPDLSFRLAKKGHKMVFAPKALVEHFHPASLRKYWKTKFFRAYWRVLLYQKNPQKIRNDSYTNPLLKWQIILFPVGLLSLAISPLLFPLSPGAIAIAVTPWVLVILLILPSSAFLFRHEPSIGFASIPIFFVNAFLFGAGLVAGKLQFLGGNQK